MSSETGPNAKEIASVLRRAVRDNIEDAPLVLTSSQRIGADGAGEEGPVDAPMDELVETVVDEIHNRHFVDVKSEDRHKDAEIDPQLRDAITQIVRQELSSALGRFIKAELRKAVQKETARHMAVMARLEH